MSTKDVASEEKIQELLEETRNQVLDALAKVDPSILPSDWDAWDVYVPPSVPPPVPLGNSPASELDEALKVDTPPKLEYSKYFQEKNEEYYDKYILD